MMKTELTHLSEVICRRRTWKVLGELANPVEFPANVKSINDTLVRHSIETAGMAPFHYDRGHAGIAEPWRAHFLDSATCRQMARQLTEWFDLKPSNKLPAMLSACGCVVLVNWLPQFRQLENSDHSQTESKKIEIDDEHLAATAAMVQNLLLLLTESNLGTYWSSGGPLGSPEMFQRLGIEAGQKLLAAVFVEYPIGEDQREHGTAIERLPGKNRELRSAPNRWLADRTLK